MLCALCAIASADMLRTGTGDRLTQRSLLTLNSALLSCQHPLEMQAWRQELVRCCLTRAGGPVSLPLQPI
jgi:hypothetical protein